MPRIPTTTFKLPNSSSTLPALGLGVYEITPSACSSVVQTALEMGYRLIDTAQCYGNEFETAKGIANFLAAQDDKKEKVTRKDVFYTTKVWDTDHGYEACKASISESVNIVRKAGIEYIDILLMHSPYGGQVAETWRAMEEAVTEGSVKFIGVSNFGIYHLDRLSKTNPKIWPPVINQLELSPWLQRTELVDYCKKKGIVVEAYAPLTQGNKLNDPGLKEMAIKYGRSPAQILIKWSIMMGFLPIPKSVHAERLLRNLETAVTSETDDAEESVFFELSQEDLKALGDINAYEYFDWDPTVSKEF